MPEFRYTEKFVALMVENAVERGLMPADTRLETSFNGSKSGRYYYVVQVDENHCQRNRRFIGQGATAASDTIYAMVGNAADLLYEKGV